jgi:DASS family divalent anion:Na+ symporter
MIPPGPPPGKVLVRGIALAVALGVWFAPVPEGLTPKAWHLFAIFGAAILSVILNVIFVGAGYLTQGELYRLGAITTAFCLLVFLVVGTPWILFVTR